MTTIEPDILDGRRSHEAAQRAFAGAPDSAFPRHEAEIGWYDGAVDENEGCFALVRAGGPLDDELIGRVVRVTWADRSIHVYCVGAADLPTDIALHRSAFFRLHMLWRDSLRGSAQVVKRSDPALG